MNSAAQPSPPRLLRLALTTGSYNFIADGVALTLNRLVAYLESHDVEVRIFAPVAKSAAFAHHGRITPAPSIPLPLRAEYRLAVGLTGPLRRELEAFDPDIVHIATPDVLGHQVQGLARRRGWPLVASYHTRYETYLKDYGLDVLRGVVADRLRAFYARCEEVYAPSPSMIDSLIAEGYADNLCLWRRGVDIDRFHPGHRDDAFRAALGFKPDDVVILFVSRLVREKRLDTLAEVLERLAVSGVAHRALIVGEGPDRAALQARLPEARFTGFLSGEGLSRAYASSDVFLFPSDTESFGNVTLEAMASGLPVICADATGSRSLVSVGETGYLAGPGDAAAFSVHAAALAADPVLRARMGAAARASSLAFSWDETMAGLLRRYRDVVARAGGWVAA